MATVKSGATAARLVAEFVGQDNTLTCPRIFARMTGSLEAGVLLSQMFYWSSRSSDGSGWFWKTYRDWEAETTIPERTARRIIKRLVERGVVETRLKKVNGAPTAHYRVDREAVAAWVIESSESPEDPESVKSADSIRQDPNRPKAPDRIGQNDRNHGIGQNDRNHNHRLENTSRDYCIGSCAPDPQKAGGPGLGLTGKEGDGRFKAERPRPDTSKFARTAAGKLRAAILRKQSGRALAAKTLAAEIDRLLRSPNNELDEPRIKAAVKWGIENYGEPNCGSIWRAGQVGEQILKWDKQARFESMPSGRNGRKLNRVDVSTIDWSKV